MQIDLSKPMELLEDEDKLDKFQQNKNWDYLMHLIKTEMEDDCLEEAWDN